MNSDRNFRSITKEDFPLQFFAYESIYFIPYKILYTMNQNDSVKEFWTENVNNSTKRLLSHKLNSKNEFEELAQAFETLSEQDEKKITEYIKDT